jgi:hypothetical protein
LSSAFLCAAFADQEQICDRKQGWEQISLLPVGVRGNSASLALAVLGECLVKMALHLALLHIVATPLLDILAARTPCGEPVEALSFSAAHFLFQLLCRIKFGGGKEKSASY